MWRPARAAAAAVAAMEEAMRILASASLDEAVGGRLCEAELLLATEPLLARLELDLLPPLRLLLEEEEEADDEAVPAAFSASRLAFSVAQSCFSFLGK